jgi:hypothetical protein
MGPTGVPSFNHGDEQRAGQTPTPTGGGRGRTGGVPAGEGVVFGMGPGGSAESGESRRSGGDD